MNYPEIQERVSMLDNYFVEVIIFKVFWRSSDALIQAKDQAWCLGS